MRWSVTLALFLGLGAAAGFAIDRLYDAHKRAERLAADAAFRADPDVVALLADARDTEGCGKDHFVWVCGTVLRLPKAAEDGRCSTPETPWFTGAVEVPDRAGADTVPADGPVRLDWTQRIRLDQGKFKACFGPDCQAFGLSASDLPWALFNRAVVPPAKLSKTLVWPDFSDISIYGHHAPGLWAEFRGMPVWFSFHQRSIEYSEQTAAVVVIAQHADLMVRIWLVLDPDQKDAWSDYLAAAFDLLSEGVVRTDPAADCAEPPLSVRFDIKPFDTETLRAVRDWRRARRE